MGDLSQKNLYDIDFALWDKVGQYYTICVFYWLVPQCDQWKNDKKNFTE